MSLSATCIRRPVLAMVLNIVVILFGVIGFTYLGVREYPAVDPPIVTVSTNYTGANADVIESQITEPLEESINGIAGIRSLTSTSREARSTITVEFDLEIDLEAAANDVRDRVSRAMRNLPVDADPPVVTKADANASPVVSINLQSDTRSLIDISAFANNVFKERLQTIPGVSEIRIWGEKKYAMRIWLDPAKMAAYQLTPLDVRNALNRENVELPSGRIEGDATELTVRTIARLTTPAEFDDLIIKEVGGNIVRLKDIGQAVLGPENERTILKRDGIPAIGIVAVPQPGANNIAIADEFYKRVEQIKAELPKDLRVDYAFDVTKYIRKSIGEVEETIFIAFGLVVLIIFLFLRDWRTTLIPVLAIPISLIGSFFIMYMFNFSINVLTLLGIVLAIGLVVDDAIVVLENIYAKVEQGMPPLQAGFKGSAEIYFAVISTTVALAAVFLPVIFLQGLTGRLFREFGIVVAGSVIISAFVSLTLTPMMSTRIIQSHMQHNWFYNVTEPFFVALSNGYRKTLHAFMHRRWLGFVAMVFSAVLIFVLGASIPSELAPLEDRSWLQISTTAPEGATFEYMDSYMSRMVDMIKETLPEAQAVMSVTSPGFAASGSVNSGFVRLFLKDPQDRTRTQQEIADDLMKKIKFFTEARTIVIQEQSIRAGGGGLPVQFVLQAPNFEKLREALPKFFEAARQRPEFQVVDVNLKFNKPEIRIDIDRNRAKALGVSASDIAQTLQLAYSGQRFGYFIMDGKQYQIIGQVARAKRDEPLDMKSLYVKNQDGNLIQLDNLVTLTEQVSPPQLYRFNRYISATVSAGLNKGYTMGEGIKAMHEIADNILDDTFSTALDGPSKDFSESSSSLLFAFLLALILIYLVLSAQFESFRGPFIILFTVPLAMAGALLSLWIFGQTLNIFSQIGQIVLIGLVTKNGILIVEFANQRLAAGLSVRDAVIDAATARLRPILMTSLSTILGILPIALALGAGSESRVPMGIAVVGGLIFSGLLTLYVIPAIYTYFTKEGQAVSNVADVPEEVKEVEYQSV